MKVGENTKKKIIVLSNSNVEILNYYIKRKLEIKMSNNLSIQKDCTAMPHNWCNPKICSANKTVPTKLYVSLAFWPKHNGRNHLVFSHKGIKGNAMLFAKCAYYQLGSIYFAHVKKVVYIIPFIVIRRNNHMLNILLLRIFYDAVKIQIWRRYLNEFFVIIITEKM